MGAAILPLSGCGKKEAPISGESSSTEESSAQAPKELSAPANLTVVSNESGNIVLKWDAVGNASSYAVFRSQYAEDYKAFSDYELIGITDGTSYTDNDSNVTANIPWYYKVQALAAADSDSFLSSGLSDTAITAVTDTLTRQPAEKLTDRALIGIDLAGDKGAEIYKGATDSEGNEYTKGVYLSWRLFEDDPEDVTFSLYRNGELIADKLTVTNCIDEGGSYGDIYKVIASSDAALGIKAVDTAVWENYYLKLSLNLPEPMVLPMKQDCVYYSNDLSVADLDNDGQYELIVKWMPSNSQDNMSGVTTGYTYIDAYDIDYTTGAAVQLWRINLGPNIRSGAHYTQYLVWDMDGDGIAEFACKTADASTTYKCVNGELIETGYVGACNADAIASNIRGRNENDYRDSGGMILNGPEYLTIFRGDTGEIIDTVDFIPGRGTVNEWGDGFGNRSDRFLACVAYLDGETPSMVFTRGYYAKTALTAYQLINGKLTVQWTYNSDEIVNALIAEFEETYTNEVAEAYKAKYNLDFEGKSDEKIYEAVLREFKNEVQPDYMGQGNHNLSVADVDNDGKDEIVFGSMVFDNDGTVLYSTRLGHGDAMHVGDFVESNPGLEVFQSHENTGVEYMVDMRDAETGKTIYGKWVGKDNGRALTADIDPRYIGSEFWSAADGYVHSSESTTDNDIIVAESRPSINFDILWDGDLLSELQDHNFNSSIYYPIASSITDWDYENGKAVELFYSTKILTNNGTKGNMGLVADILGDWREEIVSRDAEDHNAIRIYMTTIPTDYVIPCLMEDDNYRLGIAWQNTGYNQPAHLSYSFTYGLRTSVVTVSQAAAGKVVLNYTEANDGIYGHAIEGYEIYRSENLYGAFEKIASVGADVLTYTDTTAVSGKTYYYKVAGTVDGKTSYFSFAQKAVIQ